MVSAQFYTLDILASTLNNPLPPPPPPPPPPPSIWPCGDLYRNTYNLLLVLHTLYFLRATTQTTLVIKTMNAWLLILSVVSLNLHLEGEYYDFH